jgi:trk system potassium uptake protein TrkA
MRIVFVGASEISVRTAQLLLELGHAVVIVERERQVIEDIQETIDCGFLHGDGSKPAILREAGPKQTDMLFCLTDNDDTNMIASLVGRSLGFPRVITRLEDPELETICQELGLQDTIIPSLTISRYLADMVQGLNILELSTAIKNEARFFAFVLDDDAILHIAELDLPGEARAVCLYRNGNFRLADRETRIHKGDEIVILTHSKNLRALHDRWEPLQLKSNSTSN